MSEPLPNSLHRLKDNKNDWDDIPEDKLNRWQRIAKKTKGVLTLANAVTITGSASVIYGLMNFANGRKVEGIIEVGCGRISDVADGFIADKQGTKGKIGRSLDPTMDFVQLGVALPLLVEHGVLPLIPTLMVGAPKTIDGVATVSSMLRHKEMNPTNEGKKSVFAIWTGIGAFMLKFALDKHAPGAVEAGLEITGWAGVAGGSIAHLPATREYALIGFGTAQQ